MKRFIVILIAMTLITTIVASCCDGREKTSETSAVNITNTIADETTEAQIDKIMAIKDVMVSDEVPEYWESEENLSDLYQVVEIDSPVIGEFETVKFYYVSYSDREGAMYPSYLRFETKRKSEDFSVSFEETSKVFPGNISEGLVYPNSQLKSSTNFNAYRDEKSITLNGFQAGLKTVDIVFRSAMPAMEVNIGNETYDVYSIQFKFV